jgi:hypothetical protein
MDGLDDVFSNFIYRERLRLTRGCLSSYIFFFIKKVSIVSNEG